jgi:hypothetical protein
MWCDSDLILAPYVVRRRAELGLVDEPAGKPRAIVVWDSDNVSFHNVEGVQLELEATFREHNIATADLPHNMTDLLQPCGLRAQLASTKTSSRSLRPKLGRTLA